MSGLLLYSCLVKIFCHTSSIFLREAVSVLAVGFAVRYLILRAASGDLASGFFSLPRMCSSVLSSTSPVAHVPATSATGV